MFFLHVKQYINNMVFQDYSPKSPRYAPSVVIHLAESELEKFLHPPTLHLTPHTHSHICNHHF